MLRALSIRDFVIVPALDLEFEHGFTVLTGETGAGKSILIEALSLALGARSDAGVVRAGCERAEISAEFDIAVGSPAYAWLDENQLQADGACVLRRVVDRAGKSRAFINGSSVPVQQLKTLSEWLIDIHGQHAHQSLQKTSNQRDLLDAYAGVMPDVQSVRQGWNAWQQAEKLLATWSTRAQSSSEERAHLQDEVRELMALDISSEGWAALQTQHARLAHANALLEGGAFALDSLADGEGSGLARLEAASQKLQELVEFDPALKDSLDLITSAHIQVDEAVHALRRYALGVESDDAGLKQMEARLAAIMAAARRYRVAPEALGQRLHDSVTRLEALSALGSGEELEANARSAEIAYRVVAEALSARRVKAAVQLGKAITETLAGLAMGNGEFVVQLTRVEAGSVSGLDEVEFLVSTHAAQAPASLARVASGGELSRISLAIQAALSAVAAVPTLIFDEVDSGIGGRVAEIVGRLLEELGQRHQVMCVTHLPQVASRGQHHFTVTKTETASGVTSAIARLDGAERIEEVARMLGGLSITATTRRHAAEMLKSA